MTAHMVNAQHILRKFTIGECDTDQQGFVNDIVDTFDELPADYYELARVQVEYLKTVYPGCAARLQALLLECKSPENLIEQVKELVDRLDAKDKERFYNIKANRFRRIARFNVSARSNKPFEIERISGEAFVQNCFAPDDIRSKPRNFAEASNKVVGHAGFGSFLQFVCQQIADTTALSKLNVTVHQVCTYSHPDQPFVLPDGIHQDGADYIVSAIPIILDKIVVPLSTVYTPDMTPVLETKLQIGEGLLHDDRNYWHGVSAVKSPQVLGRRGTLGLDIKIVA